MVDFNKNIQESRTALQNYINMLEGTVKSNQPTGIFANVDPVMMGLAQGLLSPTKTGGFGESIGLGLAGAQAPLEAMRKRQMDAQEKILQNRLAAARLDMESPYYAARAAYYSGRSGSADGQLSPLDFKRTQDNIALIDQKLANETDPEKIANLQALRAIQEEKLSRGVDLDKYIPKDSSPSAASGDASPKESHWYDPSTWESFKGKPTEPTITGALIGEKPSKAKSINEALAEGAKSKTTEAPDEAKNAAPAEAPAEAAPETQFYTGDKPPKQFPQAQKAPDGKWYVVQDGKYRPVLK